MRRSHIGVISLQAVQRGIMTRHQLEEQRRSSATIQKVWVQHRLRSSNRLLLPRAGQAAPLSTSSVSVLAEDRLKKESNQPDLTIVRDPSHFAAMTIQSRVRFYVAKRTLENKQLSARLIQVKYFTWKMQITLLMVQSSVVLLQRSVRGQLLRSAARFALSHINASLRSSIIDSFARVTNSIDPGIASIWRAWTKAVDSAREAACIVIQSAARRMFAERYRDELRMGQPTLRRFVSRNAASAYNSIKSISSSISSKAQKKSESQVSHNPEQRNIDVAAAETPRDRSFKDVKCERGQQPGRSDSAVVIQRIVSRVRRERQEVFKHNAAACQLQKTCRRRLEMTKYIRCRAGVVCLQKRFRGALVRSEKASLTRAAVRLQREWRMRREFQRFTAILKATLLLQASYRRCRSFRAQQEAARVIQNTCRARYQAALVRSDIMSKTRASVRLQQEWRMYRERQRYQAALKAALAMQACIRMRFASLSFCLQREAASLIQNRFRAWQHRALVCSDVSLKNLASLRLQQVWRRHRERKRFGAIRKIAFLLQAAYRMRSASQSFHSQKEAALALQTTCRSWLQRNVYLVQLAAAVEIQAAVRRFLAWMTLRRALHSVVVIQRVWRRSAERQRNAYNTEESGRGEGIILHNSVPAIMDQSDLIRRLVASDYCASQDCLIDDRNDLERIQKSIVSQVENRSKSELQQLLDGGSDSLESAGICISRLVCRVADARDKINLAASDAAKRKDCEVSHHCAASELDTVCIEAAAATEGKRGDNSGVERRPHERSKAITDARMGGRKVETVEMTTESDAKVTVGGKEESSAPSTLDLATEAQQLLIEARRARTKFQQTRPENRTSSSSLLNTRPSAPRAQESFSQRQEMPMFGETVQDDDIPSPIKAEGEWNWTTGWS